MMLLSKNSKKGALWSLLLLLIIAVLLLLMVWYFNKPKTDILDLKTLQGEFRDGTTCIKESCFKVWVADNQQKRTKGLMYEKSLNNDEGMLFVFDNEGEQTMWMKNTLIPLDIIWINNEGTIVHKELNNQPCPEAMDYCPSITNTGSKAKYVLEINAGLAEAIGARTGDAVRIRLS